MVLARANMQNLARVERVPHTQNGFSTVPYIQELAMIIEYMSYDVIPPSEI